MAAVCGGGPVLIKQPTRTARLFSFASHIFLVFASISLAALYSQDCVSKKRNGKKQKKIFHYFLLFSLLLSCVCACVFQLKISFVRSSLFLLIETKKYGRAFSCLFFFWKCKTCHSRQLDVVQISMLLSASLSSAERVLLRKSKERPILQFDR